MKVIYEEAYKDSIWCKQILSGLTKELKKKRISFEQIKTIESIKENESVYAVGMSAFWMQKVISHCNELGVIPVLLSNQPGLALEGKYHSVGPDISHTMSVLRDVCVEAGRERIALYGLQNISGATTSQTSGFMQLVQDTGDIYINNGNLESCFRSFLPYAERYDVVVCMNGYAAVSLVKKLETASPKVLDNLVIISCEEILLSSRYSQWISFVDMQMETFGSTAIAISDLAAGKDGKMSIHVTVEGNVCEISPKMDVTKEYMEETDEYLLFADPEEVCMARIEQLLEEADEVDNVIIELLMNNATYSQIADDCYMTEGNIKYRVKKYLNICKVSSKKELLDMLQEYLP